jgi:hydrophobe/amphiphile efflux-1 (HAE1) family protein
VLCAVFVPVAFVSGLTGEFYRQFALTIAISAVISAFNSLTLSPALAAALLKPHDQQTDWLARTMRRFLGKPFGVFNRAFASTGNAYSRGLVTVLRRSGLAVGIYGVLIVLTYLGLASVPGGFIPLQDKQYVVAVAQLPPAASLDRTEEVTRAIGAGGLSQPGVTGVVQFAGMSTSTLNASPSSAMQFFKLDDFDKRTTPDKSVMGIVGALNQKFSSIQEAFVGVFPAPPIQGMGTLGGFKLHIEDRSDQGAGALYQVTQEVIGKAYQNPALAGVFSSYQVNVPQLKVNVDRIKAKQLDVKLSDIFQTMQVYLGSLYVNDFNRFGRTYQVVAQADAKFRAQKEDILKLKTRNAHGDMVPLGALVTIEETFGPDVVAHYNGFRSADLNGGPAPGYSSGQAEAAITKILNETLPRGMTYEWTDLTYQQKATGDTTSLVFALCVVFVFLVLAAQYESLSLPLAIVLIVPMTLLAAITGVLITHGDNNIFTQIGLVVLVGLASKNAILIVEFAKHLQEDRGLDAKSAVLEAARLRLRPILMTSIAFIAGVIPLVFASGAGAEIRHALGVVVFAGMIGVTVFGLLLTPVFYVLVRRLNKRERKALAEHPEPSLPHGVASESGHA